MHGLAKLLFSISAVGIPFDSQFRQFNFGSIVVRSWPVVPQLRGQLDVKASFQAPKSAVLAEPLRNTRCAWGCMRSLLP